ncbi:MAG TPA: pantoate--beta-alanine ligase [Nitrospiraceae bacterium]|nr:pantoate--beta-alanine ligase [Nitrospiraceae bacterium]
MNIITVPRAMAVWSRRLHREGVTIGLVPTMGALHEGHRALIRKARLSCDALVVSVFVNPRQFGPAEDLTRYPRPFAQDRALCAHEGVDVLFAPSREAMYPPGFQTVVALQELARRWEGTVRPHHFQGVATVVTKLLCLVRPHVVVFGQKDYQQALLVQRLVEDLNLGARVVVHPTVREPDGLALSSRNVYLTTAQRRAAPVLYRALRAGWAAIRSGIRSEAQISRIMHDTVAAEPLAQVDYLALCDARTLEPLRRAAGKVALLGAIRIGKVRLIDNLLVTVPAKKRTGGRIRLGEQRSD